jgi:hypothetical protein
METVINAIKRLILTDPSVELLNFYKSYPMAIRAKIITLENDNLTLSVSPPGSVCLYQNKTTILLSNNLHDAIRARVVHFDISAEKVELSNLGYISSWIGRRMIVRVQPGQAIPVTLERGGMVIRGNMADVSLNGMGVVVTNPIVKKEDSFQISVQLPEGDLSLPGRVVEVTPLTAANRLAIKFTANSKEIALILKYISKRRMELQDEVQRLYEKVFQTARA